MFFTPLLQGGAQQQAAQATAAPATFRQRVRWTRQPQGPVEIDWSNPLTRGLQCALSPYFEHATNRRPTYSGTMDYGTRAFGRSLKGNNAGLAFVPVSGVGVPATILYAGSINRTANTNLIAGLGSSTGTQLLAFQCSTTQAGNKIILRQTTGDTNRFFATNATTVSAEKVVLCGVVNSSSSVDAYWNGKLDNGTLNGGSTGDNSAFDRACLGGVRRTGNTPADVGNDGALFCYWNRALTASEIAAISANPWQLFKPASRTFALSAPQVSAVAPTVFRQRLRWTRQPQGAVAVDWSNPLTQGLVICTHAGNNFREMVTNKPSTITSATYAPTAEGRALMDSASNFSIETPVNTNFGEAVTWFFLARPDGLGGNNLGRFFDKRATSQPAVEYLFFNGSLANLSYERIANGGITQSIVTSTSGIVAGGVCSVAVRVGSFTSNANAAIFVNGVSKTLSTNTAGTAVISTNTGNYVLGNRNDDFARNFDGRMYCAYRWNRALSDNEIKSVSVNPYQIFKPVTRTITGTAVISSVTIYRPTSDITTTGWTASSGSVLYDMVDEVTPSDADYIVSPNLSGTPGAVTFGISSMPAGSYTVSLRARETAPDGQVRVVMKDAGGTSVGASAWQPLSLSFTTYSLSLTTTGTATQLSIEVQ